MHCARFGSRAASNRDAVRALLASAGLLVVPSLWPEPFGLVGFEAAAHGVPVAGFRVGGIPEWLIDGVTGHLADPLPDPVAGCATRSCRRSPTRSTTPSLRRGARAAHAGRGRARPHRRARTALEHDVLGVAPS